MMQDTNRIFWSKAQDWEGHKTIMHPYSNESFYRVPVNPLTTLADLRKYEQDNTWNWHTVRFEGFGTYSGEFFAYFSVDIGIGD